MRELATIWLFAQVGAFDLRRGELGLARFPVGTTVVDEELTIGPQGPSRCRSPADQMPRRRLRLRLLTRKGRLVPGVNIADRDLLYEVMEGRR